METPPPTPDLNYDVPLFDVFGTVLKMIRVVAIVCALILAGAGGVLAWNLFFFVKEIVLHPEEVVGRWQTAVTPAPQTLFAPEVPSVPPAPAPQTPADPAAAPVPAAPAVVVPPAEPAATEAPVTPVPIASDAAPDQYNAHENDDTEQFLNFAESVLNRFEAGHFSWLVSMFFLVMFCWILGKIPGVMISLGGSLATALLNHEKAKT